MYKRQVHNVDTFSFGSAYLGTETHPFRISADPNEDNFKVENLTLVNGLGENRLGQRLELLQGLDQIRRADEVHGVFIFFRATLWILTVLPLRVAVVR